MKKEFRAEHVGSLLRPPRLLRARAYAPETALLEDLAIKDAIQVARHRALDILSDGEMRRGSWLTDMADAVDGFVAQKVMMDWKGPDGGGLEASTANAKVGAKLHKPGN